MAASIRGTKKKVEGLQKETGVQDQITDHYVNILLSLKSQTIENAADVYTDRHSLQLQEILATKYWSSPWHQLPGKYD